MPLPEKNPSEIVPKDATENKVPATNAAPVAGDDDIENLGGAFELVQFEEVGDAEDDEENPMQPILPASAVTQPKLSASAMTYISVEPIETKAEIENKKLQTQLQAKNHEVDELQFHIMLQKERLSTAEFGIFSSALAAQMAALEQGTGVKQIQNSPIKRDPERDHERDRDRDVSFSRYSLYSQFDAFDNSRAADKNAVGTKEQSDNTFAHSF